MKAFKIGVESSKKNNNSASDIEAQIIEENKKNVEAGVKLKEKELKIKKQNFAQEINNALVNNPTPEQLEIVAEKIQKHHINSFDAKDLEKIDISALEEILNVFK